MSVQRVFASVVSVFVAAVSAGEPNVNPNGPVIFYDGFERPTRFWANGTLTDEKAARPDSQSRKLAPAQDKKSSSVQVRLNEMKVKLLGPAPSNAVHVGVFVFGTELKGVRIEFNGKETYSYTEDEVPDNKWTEISCNVSQAKNGKKSPPNTFEFTAIKVVAIPKGGSAPTAYIDDFILTVGTTPRAAWPQMIAQDIQRASRTGSVTSDGFEYSEAMDEALRVQLKDAIRRPSQKGVLAVSPGKEPGALAEALKSASKRTVNALTLPEGVKLASAADMRLFLPTVMKENNSDFVLLNLSGRAFMSLNAAEAVLIGQRCATVGAVAIWVIPTLPSGAKPEDVKKLDDNQKRVTTELARNGIPYINAAHALKDAKDAWEGEELKDEGLKALAKLAEEAMALIEKSVKGRL